MDPGNPVHSRQRVVLPVHYPGRVHRAGQVTAYPTRTSMDPNGNPITVLTVDQHSDPQGLFPPQSTSAFLRSYHPSLHLDHSINPHHCGMEHRGPPAYPAQPHHAAFKRPKFHGRNFSRAACFSQYETMYQHYYFQGLTFPQQPESGQGPAVVGQLGGGGGPHKGHHSRAFQQGLLYPMAIHMAPASSSRMGDGGSTSGLSCYHGHRSVCSGYLADCPGSDSSSSSSGQCHCSSSDSMLDCTEVSNQGVYGSCSTFRSSLSSDYDPYIYRSKSPCRGSTGDAGAAASSAFPAEDSSSPAPTGHDCLPLPPGASGYNSGDHLSNCSLEPSYSSHSSLEPRENNTSTTSAGAPEDPGADRGKGPQEDSGELGAAACSCCFEVLPPNMECKGQDSDQAGPLTAGRFHRVVEFQSSSTKNYFAHEHMCPSSEQVNFEGLPCCFYKEMKVHRASAGRYTEDYAVNVQYAHTDLEACSGQGCCELNQRIPIIPEDTNCELGTGAETQSSLLPISVKVEAEVWTGEQQEPREGYMTSGQYRGPPHSKEEETRALFHPPLTTSLTAPGSSTSNK